MPRGLRGVAGMRSPGARASLLLALVAGAVYSNSFGAGYTLDNATILATDPRLASLSARNLQDIFGQNYWWPRFESDLYRPLTTLSYLLNFQLTGGDRSIVWPLHAVNLLLHWLNALLVFSIGWRVLGAVGPAAFLAAVFTAHPLATENVTNLVGRADLLATFFVLLGLYLHRRLRDGTAHPRLALVALGASAIAGVFCKESAVVLVGLIALHDLCFPTAREGAAEPRLADWGAWWRSFRSGGWRSYAAVAPALGLLFCVRRLLFHASPVFTQVGSDNPLVVADPITARITALGVIGRYLRLILWPRSLSCDYSYDQISLFGWSLTDPRDVEILVTIAALAGIVASTLRWGRRNRPLLFFVGLFVVTLLPVSNLIVPTGTIMAERFAYLPLVGVVGALLVTAVPWLGERVRRLRPERPGHYTLASAIVAAGVVGALGARAFARNLDWRDELALWTSASRATPGSYKAWSGLAKGLLAADPERPDLERALTLLERAQSVFATKPLPILHLPAQLYDESAQVALRLGDRATRAAGFAPPAANAAGRPYYLAAEAAAQRAVEIDAALSSASRQARLERGVPADEIVEVGNSQFRLTLAHSLARLGRIDEARAAFQAARRLEPARYETHLSDASFHRVLGELRPAALRYLQALVLTSDRTELWQALGEVYQRIDPAVPAITSTGAGPALNLDHPTLRRDLRAALEELVELLDDAHRDADAARVARLALRRFGFEVRR